MIRRKIWLIVIWIVKIFFAPKHYKVPFWKKLYYNFYGFTSNQVALYDLNKKNKKEYLSEFDWYKSRDINGKYSFILNNKLVCNDLIKAYVKTPDIYVIKKDNFYGYEKQNYDLNKVISILKAKKSVYFKPVMLGKGRGVAKIDYKNKKFFINYKSVTDEKLKDFLDENNNYFISASINQASYLNKIYDKTTNTIRIITVREKGSNAVKVLWAVQRFGTSETIPVDNGSKGGLVASIDLKTGRLSAARCLYNKKIYQVHPDSKGQIEGVVIPHFVKLKEDVINLMEKLPYISFAAWDVLVTNRGFYVLEANTSSGINIIQVFGGQKNKELGDFYRSYKIIK